MRFTILSCLLLMMVGCAPDLLVPCSVEGPIGLACREYRYYDDNPLGYVEFQYLGDSVVSNFLNRNSSLEKTVIERFNNNRIVSITNQFPNQPSVVGTYHYNDLDSVFLIVYGANDSSLQISYENGKRLREVKVVASDTIRSKEYRYFQDGGALYRISEFDGSGTLTAYRNFDYFNTNGIVQYRTTEYTPDHQLIGRKVYTFSQLGLISSMEFRLTDNTIAESMEYIYDGAGKLIEKNGQRLGITSKSVYLYY